MNKTNILLGCAAIALAACGEPSGDRPDARHAWAVHDVNRPDPIKVTVPVSGVPSDATVLFDGSVESVRKNWRDRAGGAVKWVAKDGSFVCTPGSGAACTAERFGDCQLHVEWKTPVNDVEGWGNSGVIFMGRYEIQILDSSAIVPSRSPWKSANYADGQAGAVYGQHPSLVNASRRPGEWQSFDIVFHPPYRESGRLVDTGSFTVFHNGVLIQDAWPLEGMTTWCRRLTNHIEVAEAPLCLQDHGHPVAFRNIWIRRIPSRFAETTCGGPNAKLADVKALRHRLAKESLDFANVTQDPAERYIRLYEAQGYEATPAVAALLPKATADLVAALAAHDPRVVGSRRIGALTRFVRMLRASGLISADDAALKAIETYKAPPKPKAPNLRDV